MPVTPGAPSAGDPAREAASTDGRGKDRANRLEAAGNRPAMEKYAKAAGGDEILAYFSIEKGPDGRAGPARQQHAEADWRAVNRSPHYDIL